MKGINNYDDIFVKFEPKAMKYLYFDKQIDNRGIDYTRFIQLKYESINNNEITKKYTINGWYLLFYLMSVAQDSIYLETTINMIAVELKYKPCNIIEIIKHLESIKVIKVKDKIKTNNTKLHIAIGYNIHNIVEHKKNGFIAIPCDYIKTVLPKMTPTQWAILSVLFVRYNYIYPTNKIDYETGEYIYYTLENCYSFPTLDQISVLVGLKDIHSTKRNIDILTKELKLITYDKVEAKDGGYSLIKNEITNKSEIQRFNLTYHIKLLERIEYAYYCIYNVKDYRISNPLYISFLDDLKRKGYSKIRNTSNNEYLNRQDFIKVVYGTQMQEYKQLIEQIHKNNNVVDEDILNTYKFLRQQNKIESANKI